MTFLHYVLLSNTISEHALLRRQHLTEKVHADLLLHHSTGVLLPATGKDVNGELRPEEPFLRRGSIWLARKTKNGREGEADLVRTGVSPRTPVTLRSTRTTWLHTLRGFGLIFFLKFNAMDPIYVFHFGRPPHFTFKCWYAGSNSAWTAAWRASPQPP
jgi:hypothetical protein